MMDMNPNSDGYTITIKDRLKDRNDTMDVDIVILCTGAQYRRPAFLDPMMGKLNWGTEGYSIREDYSIEWDGPSDLNIYMQNGAKHTRGVADPNLSLMAWRSATIINSMAKREVYDIKMSSCVFDMLHVNLEELALL
jgi:lysine N6-hydroxylase